MQKTVVEVQTVFGTLEESERKIYSQEIFMSCYFLTVNIFFIAIIVFLNFLLYEDGWSLNNREMFLLMQYRF